VWKLRSCNNVISNFTSVFSLLLLTYFFIYQIDEGRFKEDRMEGQGTMKMSRNVIIPTLAPGAVATDDEKDASGNDGDAEMADADAKEDSATKKKPKQSWMIPLQFQSDIGHIHMRAGFTQIGL
jgi:hypothetical protein